MELVSELELQLLTLCMFAVSHTSTSEIIEQKIEPVFVTGQSSAEMSCCISLSNGSQLHHYNTIWLKGATPVSELKDSRFTVSANGSLIIDKPTYADVGMYIVRFQIRPQYPDQYSCRVRFLGEPVVEDLGRPFNRAVGQNLKLTCIVQGYPVIITWYKDDSEIRFPQNDTRVLLKPVGGHKNAQLQVMDVSITDSGTYRCEAWSEFFNKTASDSLRVRVTERYAAVLPFLGLFAEVTLLCLVIFLYERYQKKQTQKRSLHQHIRAVGRSTIRCWAQRVKMELHDLPNSGHPATATNTKWNHYAATSQCLIKREMHEFLFMDSAWGNCREGCRASKKGYD